MRHITVYVLLAVVVALLVASGRASDDGNPQPSTPVRPASLSVGEFDRGSMPAASFLPNTPQGRELALARHRAEAKSERGQRKDLEDDSDSEDEGDAPWYRGDDWPKKPQKPRKNVDPKGGDNEADADDEWNKYLEWTKEEVERIVEKVEKAARQGRDMGELDRTAEEAVAARLRKQKETIENVELGPTDRARADSTRTLDKSDVESDVESDDGNVTDMGSDDGVSDDGSEGGSVRSSSDNQPYPLAFPRLTGNDGSATSAARCWNSRYCEKHFFPTFEAHVKDLVAGGMQADDARELSCTACMEFLCCERDHALYFNYKSLFNQACAAHCRPLSEDFRALEYYHWLEWDNSVEWTYLREYLRVVTDANFFIYRNSQFRAFRNIMYELRSAQSTHMAERMKSLPREEIEFLASGGNSQLYKATSKGTTFVIKRPYVWGENLPTTLVNEINANEVLRYSDNPHLVRYFGYYVSFDPDTTQYINLVYEYCGGGDMARLWKERSEELKGRPDVVADLFAQMVVGLRDLSINRIAHRDLKLDNIFIATKPDEHKILEVGDLQVKIGDFDRAVMWPKAEDSSSISPIDASASKANTMFYAALDGTISLGIDTVDSYPRELATIRDNLMPPEAIFAALGNLEMDEFERLLDSIDGAALAELLPSFKGRPTASALKEAISSMDPRLLEKYDTWQLGVMALQLLTGMNDPVEKAFTRTSSRGALYNAQEWSGGARREFNHLGRNDRAAAMGTKRDSSLCDPNSPRAEDRVVCCLEQQQYLFANEVRRTAALNELLAGMGDAKTIYAGLQNVFVFQPDHRTGVMNMADEILLSDAIRRVETNDRYLDIGLLDYYANPVRRPNEMEPERNRWETCSVLSFTASPISPAPSLRSRSIRSSESAGRLFSGSPSRSSASLSDLDTESESSGQSPSPVRDDSSEMGKAAGMRGLNLKDLGADDHDDGNGDAPPSPSSSSVSDSYGTPRSMSMYSLSDYEGSPSTIRGSMYLSTTPTISNNEDSPYSPLFYFREQPWTQSAPPTVVVVDDSKIRSDILDEGEMGEILARAYPRAGLKDIDGNAYPEASYILDPQLPDPYSRDDRYTQPDFENVAVHRVKHHERARDVYRDMDVTTDIFTKDPVLPRSLYGYLTVHLDVDVSFGEFEYRPDAVVRAFAYSDNELVARPLATFGWVSLCDGLPRGESYYDLSYKEYPAYCDKNARVKRIRLKMLVDESEAGSALGTWTIRLITRTKGSSYEKCSNVEVVSPLNLLDLRWNSAIARAMLPGSDERAQEACNACRHEWAITLRRLVYFMPSDSAFLPHDFDCPSTQCRKASEEIRRMLVKVPRSQRSVLLSMGPREGCEMITSSYCSSDTDHTEYAPTMPVGVCLKAKHDRLQDRNVTPRDPINALNDFPKCPDGSTHPNVLPQYAPTAVYQGWHTKMGCDMCKFVVTTARQLWRFGTKKHVEQEDVCDIKERHISQVQHGIYSQLKRIWPSHYYGNLDTKLPSNRFSAWPSHIKEVGHRTRTAESFMCALPWMEREILLCRNIQESLLLELESGDDGTKMDDPTLACQQMFCCPTE